MVTQGTLPSVLGEIAWAGLQACGIGSATVLRSVAFSTLQKRGRENRPDPEGINTPDKKHRVALDRLLYTRASKPAGKALTKVQISNVIRTRFKGAQNLPKINIAEPVWQEDSILWRGMRMCSR